MQDDYEKNYDADANYKALVEVLKSVYDGCEIDEYELEMFAADLCDYFFDEQGEINDIFTMVECFENQMRDDGAHIENDKQLDVYYNVINLLEVNESNAKRLCESFSQFTEIQCFILIMEEFRDVLTKEQEKSVMDIAKRTFLPFIWEPYE